MPEILLCNRQIGSHSIESQCGVTAANISGLGCTAKPTSLLPYQPYLLGPAPSSYDRNLMAQLGAGGDTQNLTNLSLSFGEDNTLALADITAKLQEYQIGLMGTATSVYAHRVQGFGLAVKKYQEALLEYRNAIKTNPAARVMARQKAYSAFQQMQLRFRHELAAVSSVSKAKKGTPLNNPVRATNIARSSRNVAKLNITSQVQASNLVKYSRQAKFLGNGLAVIDFGTRVGNIQNSYKAGGNWEREMFIESSSFAASASTGILTTNAGAAVLGFLMVATPIGWVGLIIGGVVVLGAATAATITVNSYTKENSGKTYDQIMKWIDSQ